MPNRRLNSYQVVSRRTGRVLYDGLTREEVVGFSQGEVVILQAYIAGGRVRYMEI